MPADILHLAPGFDCGVEHTGAVQMGTEFSAHREGPYLGEIAFRNHLATNGVLERDQAGAREVSIARFDRCADLGERDRPIWCIFQRLRLDASQDRPTAAPVVVGMDLLADAVFTPSLAKRQSA